MAKKGLADVTSGLWLGLEIGLGLELVLGLGIELRDC